MAGYKLNIHLKLSFADPPNTLINYTIHPEAFDIKGITWFSSHFGCRRVTAPEKLVV